MRANLLTYYKLASNLMDYQKNLKAGKPEEEPGPKRTRSSSSTVDSEEGSTSNYNPPKRKKEDHKGRTSGSH